MFVSVSRFHFRTLDQDEARVLRRRAEHDIPRLLRDVPGFRAFYLSQVGDDEVLAVWLWESRDASEQALKQVGPWLLKQVLPVLDRPPERIGGDVLLEVTA